MEGHHSSVTSFFLFRVRKMCSHFIGIAGVLVRTGSALALLS